MIGYPITEDDLWNRINAFAPHWKTEAEQRTAALVRAGKYDEPSGIWGKIKPVYMALRYSKCGYCEKWLESADYGAIEHDVEHFWPKSRVRAYPPIASRATSRDARSELNYDFTTGVAWETGYFRLAYHPLNYLTSCKTCNSILKSDYSPVAAARIDGAAHPHDLRDEQPFLICPLSDLDVAPETLIGFEGITAIPIAQTLAERHRAQVTIDFFQFNNREDLRRQRAEAICGLSLALTGLQRSSDDAWKRDATRLINRQMLPQARHANCSRCFVRLFQSDTSHAVRLADEASQLLP